jgi:hypothetical protein
MEFLLNSLIFTKVISFILYPPQKKKHIIKVLAELTKLTRYWNAFPDTYFRFGMFMKTYNDFERMKSFILQGAYYKLSADAQPKYHVLIDDKIIFHDIMTQYGLPVLMRYFTFRGGEFRKGAELMADIEVDFTISNINDERIFVKRFTGGAASGVSVFTRKEKGVYIDSDNDIVSAAMIRKKYTGQDFLFEKQIIQEPVLSKFNPDTVNTIRVMTFKDKVISAAVRFGCKGSFVDNTAKGGVAVSLDIETGMLESYGMREYDLNHYTEHPDSHLKFENTIVTQWPAVKKLVEKTLKFLPYYQSVGFDVATTKEGPVIIEINTGAGIYLSQMGKDKGLIDKFKQ